MVDDYQCPGVDEMFSQLYGMTMFNCVTFERHNH